MLRHTMCSNCSCKSALWELVRYRRGDKMTDIELLGVRELIDGRHDFKDENGKDDIFRCYMDAKDEIKCRGLKMAFDYIDKHNLKFIKK